MSSRRLTAIAVLASLVALSALGAAPAVGAPLWNLGIHHHETNFSPGNAGDLRVETVADGGPGSNEVQSITLTATQGQFRLAFGADSTPDLPIKTTAAQLENALSALPSIGPGNVLVTGYTTIPDKLGSYTVTFTGALAGTDVPELVASNGAVPLTTPAQYWFEIWNIGDTATSGLTTLTVNLPAGITRSSVKQFRTEIDWSCPGNPGDSVIVCTTTDPIRRHSLERGLILSVSVDPGIPPGSDRFLTATLSGGGAPSAPPAANCAPGVGACAFERTHISPVPAPFGIVDDTFVMDFFEADALTPVRRAGSHPHLLTSAFDFTSIDRLLFPEIKNAAGSIRNLTVDLPPGFVGDPTAVGECTAAKFAFNACPLSSQVGRIDLDTHVTFASEGSEQFTTGVFNLTHPRGAVSDLVFAISGNPVHIRVSLDPARDYAIKSTVSDVNETLPAFHQKLTLWGVPADSSHDSERCTAFSIVGFGGIEGPTSEECSTDIERKPFLTVPSQCEEDSTMRLHSYDSWQNSGVFGPDLTYTLPGKFTDCDRPRFEPSVEVVPTGKEANTPTGLDVHIKLAQNDSPDALATPPVKRTVVTLPEGMSFSPSFADGLESCTPAQIGLFTNNPVKCPDASRIGEVRLSTPLLPKAIEGSMYLAAQGDNPFHSTFAMYMEVHDTEERGILIKIPGRIDVDPVTGQITTVFDDLPQFPFDDFTLKFRSGPRAPLVSPPTCGQHTIGVEVASYAQPDDSVDASNSYEISEGPNGTPCPPDSANRPFAPRFNAGTLNPVAGSYSPFVFRLAREDHEQELSQVTTLLPPGLVAKIAGIPFCPEAALASISRAEGTGKNELATPACPAASQVGSVSAGLGAGPGPNYFPGKVYLAGPYKGAPLSLAVVAPALAGPIDLGSVIVRTPTYVDTETGQVKAVSDPFPAMLHGVILRVRDVRLKVDRPETTINPTSCAPMSVDGQISGVGGSLLSTADDSLFAAQSPFQVGECGSLAFKPRLSFRLFGGTKRGAHPKLRATVRFPAGGANTRNASVALPRSEFLDQSHIGTVCTRVQFKANACPAASVYGAAEAKSPLLDEVLSGPIYLRSSDNPLPDLVAAFRGGRVDFNLVGRIDSVRGGIRNTFDLVPDVPVSWAVFTFQGGNKGLLINSRNLCTKTYRATALFKSHNGRSTTLRPEMRNSCRKARKGSKRSR